MEKPYSNNVLTSIADLPDDCLFFIFQGLDCFSDRESFGLTCRGWLNIQNTSRRSLQFACSFVHLTLASLSHPQLNITSHHLSRLLARFQHLQSLSLSGCTYISDTGLTSLQNYRSNLQYLYLDYCCSLTDVGFSRAAKACPLLTVLSLYRCNITNVGLETMANACPGIEQINLSYCDYISDRGVKALSQMCRRLKAVRISCCRGMTGIGFTGCSSTLAYVEAVSCNLKPEGVKGIVSGGGIEYLDFTELSWNESRNGLAAIGMGFASGLKVLNLRLCRTVSNQSISVISKGCPLLEEWNLSLCHEVKTPGWTSIGANCNSLGKLHVNRCRNLSDEGLLALRNGCKQLSVLYMSGCPKITSAAIQLFKWNRNNVVIKREEVICIGPKLAFR